MSIVCFSGGMRPHKRVTCVLCGKPMALEDATAGLLYADGRQAFAHSAHMQGRAEWFVGWAIFIATERHKLLDQGITPLYLDEMDG